MNSLAWLNDLMVWLGRWIPRVLLVKAGEAALWYGRKGRTRELFPGLYVYWPITTEVTVVSTKRRTIEQSGKVNGREIVTMVATWSVAKPSAILVWNNVVANIDDRSAAALSRRYSIDVDSSQLAASVLRDLREEFGPAGIEIESVDVTQRAPIRALRLMNDWSAAHEGSSL